MQALPTLLPSTQQEQLSQHSDQSMSCLWFPDCSIKVPPMQMRPWIDPRRHSSQLVAAFAVFTLNSRAGVTS